MIKRTLIVLFSICILSASAQKSTNNGNHQGGGNNGNGVGNNGDIGDPDEGPVDVPLDDYVPFLVAGVVVYGVLVNQKRKTVQMEQGF